MIHANGYICRESFSLGDRPENFYMIGSMGLASAIGLGLTLARDTTPTVVFDGDGNLLMNLGVLPLVAALGPRRFVHVVFDNEVYGSTGGQRSISGETRLDRIAAPPATRPLPPSPMLRASRTPSATRSRPRARTSSWSR